MKRFIMFIILALLVVCGPAIAADMSICTNKDVQIHSSGGSSQWTGTTTITPTTATSTAAGYTSNTTTGVFQFGTQASEGMRYSPVTGGGRLGIGTTAPAGPLDLSPTGSIASTAAVIRGRTGIGTATTPAALLHVANAANTVVGTPVLFVDGDMELYGDLTMRGNKSIKSTANIPIVYGNGSSFTVATNTAITNITATGTSLSLTPTFGVTIDGSGIPLNVDKNGLIGTTVSGSRYKTNIVEASVGDHVYLMKPKSWDYRKRVPVYGDVKIDGTRDILSYTYPDEASNYHKLGLIAEDLDAIDSRYINLREADGTAKNYDDRAVINALVQNAKDQKAEIDAMKKAFADILNRLEALEAK